jgi:hypothetical protein
MLSRRYSAFSNIISARTPCSELPLLPVQAGKDPSLQNRLMIYWLQGFKPVLPRPRIYSRHDAMPTQTAVPRLPRGLWHVEGALGPIAFDPR